MSKPTCAIDGCGSPVSVKSRGWCNKHYIRWTRHGDPLVTRKRPHDAPADECSVDGCSSAATSVGMCHRHRESLRRNGTPIPTGERSPLQRLKDVGWTVSASGCWEWSGYRNDNGYGIIMVKRKRWIASRLMLELHQTAPAADSVCRHRCDNPSCVNPDHLEWGTQLENAADMVERKREQSYRADYWGGLCKNGLHDITLPGALQARGGMQTCVECRRASR